MGAGARGLKVLKDLACWYEQRGATLRCTIPSSLPCGNRQPASAYPSSSTQREPVPFFCSANSNKERVEELLRHPQMASQHGGGRGGIL